METLDTILRERLEMRLDEIYERLIDAGADLVVLGYGRQSALYIALRNAAVSMKETKFVLHVLTDEERRN